MGGRIHGAKAWTEAKAATLTAAVDAAQPAPTAEEFQRAVGAAVGMTGAAVKERMRKMGLRSKVLAREDRPRRVYDVGG